MEIPPTNSPNPVEAQLPLTDRPSTAIPIPTQNPGELVQNPAPMHEVVPEQACHVGTSQECAKDTSVADTNSGALDGGTGTPEEPPKKRKRNLRGVRSKAPNNNIGSPSTCPLPPNDQLPAGLSATLSNLLSKHGVLQEQFYEAFYVCDDCKRIVSNETSRLDGHTCVIEVEE